MSSAMDVPRRHRLKVEDYYRMAEAGILRPDERVELIEGEIIDVPSPGSLHAGTVEQLAETLRAAVGTRAAVRVQNPIRLDDYSEPQPDLALVRPRADFYKSAHPSPTDVLLIVEVAHSSLAYDRDIKMPLYARRRIPEVWLVDLVAGQLTRYRTPTEIRYLKADQPALEWPVEMPSLPGLQVDLGRLFDSNGD